MTKVPKTLTAAILSMSLLTVMAGAAIAPALGIIKSHFADANPLLVQFIISLPALFIIITNLTFSTLCRFFKTQTLAIIGLALYVVCGSMPFLLDNIWLILLFRALLGVSVGIIMPLSTGLLSFYFPPEKMPSLMGLSAAMNQMGGVVATLLAGVLATVSWNYAFLVYLLGLFAITLVIIYLPNEKLQSPRTREGEIAPSLGAKLKRFHPSIVGMFLCMSLFFVYPANFAICAEAQTTLSHNAITIIMVGLDVVAFFVGLAFGPLMKAFPKGLKYFAPVLFIAAYALLAASSSVASLLIASFLIGFANGVGVPYINTVSSIKGGKDAVTTIMPLISASLYLGQFLSPIYISSLGNIIFDSIRAPYIMACIIGIVYFVQVLMTRK